MRYIPPAIWLLPEDWLYGEWPVSGEIDIVESRGGLPCKVKDRGLAAYTGSMWSYKKDVIW